jgi:hypothetical protein
MTNAFKAAELLYLSMLCGADEVSGIPDVFHGKTDDEIKNFITETAKICENRNLYKVDFDGKMNLNESIDKTIRIIATADKFTEVIIRNTKKRQKRYLIYYKKDSRAVILESGGEYFITEESEFDKAFVSLDILFADGCLLKPETSVFMITKEEASDIRAGTKPKTSVMRALMREKGVDEVTALLVAEGMAGRAGYFSAMTLNHINNDIKAAVYIADSGLALQISADEKHNLNYTAVNTEEAKQNALSFMGGNFYV